MEQRRSQRFPLRLPIAILQNEARALSGETRDMSSSGVSFTADGPMFIGQSIEYNITFPRAPKARAEVILRCMGKVVRLEGESSTYAATLERYEFIRQPFGRPVASTTAAAMQAHGD